MLMDEMVGWLALFPLLMDLFSIVSRFCSVNAHPVYALLIHTLPYMRQGTYLGTQKFKKSFKASQNMNEFEQIPSRTLGTFNVYYLPYFSNASCRF